MPTLSEQLLDILSHVQRPGDFYVSGTVEIFPPRLEVEGVGLVALPLLPAQAEQIVAVAERAPYGKGEQTIVDTEVRRTWQLAPDRFSLGGKHWQGNLELILEQVKTGLGVSGTIKAELYKLLIYGEGDFFVTHRDTEKAEGMFATLVIVLPSEYQGGELRVSHQDREVTLDLHRDDSSEAAFAAFYADCRHQVQPIISGCRLTLIYNLIRQKKEDALPQPPDYRKEQAQLAEILRHWSVKLDAREVQEEEGEEATEQLPEKLVYLLEHAYTPAALSLLSLKNGDAAVGKFLAATAEQAECDLYLALVALEESGGAEYTGYYGRRHGRYEGPELEIGEIIESSTRVGEWRTVDGRSPELPELPELPVYDNELCPPGAFGGMEPDEFEFHEATGNEGATFERSYCRAAVVLWPRKHAVSIIHQVGLSASLPALEALVQQWDGKDPEAKTRQNACRLARSIAADWPGQSNYHYRTKENSLGRFLACLRRLDDHSHIESVWRRLAAEGFRMCENDAALAEAADVLPWPQVLKQLEVGVQAGAMRHPDASAGLLAQLAVRWPDQAHTLSPAASALFAVLPGDSVRNTCPSWEQPRIDEHLVVDLLKGFSLIDPPLAEKTLEYIVAWPSTYKLDKVLVPAALSLWRDSAHRALPAIAQLREKIQGYLQARVDLPLAPFPDWQRDASFSCNNPDCEEFKRFLEDPAASVWRFKAGQQRRQVIEGIIKMHHCDVDCTTERAGSPHTLICTKNQASYRLRAEQRKQDLAWLADLA
jgi:predicted 2-oxoglutarate/Fe(II)-dependent dioxygenase YbiX